MSNIEGYLLVPLGIEHSAEMTKIENRAQIHPWSEAGLKDCFGPLYRVVGIRQQNNLLGFAIVQQVIDEATLLDICIDPAHQGLGLGLLLLRQVLKDAKEADAVVLMLEVRQSNRVAMGLYEKVGFIGSGRRRHYYQTAEGHEDAILMDKAL